MGYPELIGLTGYAGSGKDLVAALLKMVGYNRFGFADSVRKEVQDSFVDGSTLPLMPEHIMSDWIVACSCDTEDDRVLNTKPMLTSARHILQWWGTEYRRVQDPNYWINKIAPKISTRKLGKREGPVVISDVRFLNEANWIERWDGIIWRIERPGTKSDGHQSENECNLIKADYTIKNDGDLQHLADQVCTALEVFNDETSKSSAD